MTIVLKWCLKDKGTMHLYALLCIVHWQCGALKIMVCPNAKKVFFI